MNRREIHPWDMLPADYAGITIAMFGLAIAFRAAMLNDGWLMMTAATVTGVGTLLKFASTRYKGRIDRERRARQDRNRPSGSARQR